MTIQAQLVQSDCTVDWTPAAAVVGGEVIQLRDGRAAVVNVDAASGVVVGTSVEGVYKVQKTTSMVVLKGSPLYWDHSADKCHLLHRNDRDFYLGTAQEDATSSATTVLVDLNVQPVYTLSLASGYHSIPISTAGWPHIYGAGNSVGFKFDLTAEAQKLDALTLRGMAVESLAIVDALFCINLNGDAASADFNIGVANASHATDADAITEHLFAHIDGASLNIMAQSADGTTTVTTTDTTIDAVVGTPILVQWDLRNTSDIQMYINGVNVLPSTVFKLNAATGPLKLLAHLEKDANDTPGNFTILNLGARTAQV